MARLAQLRNYLLPAGIGIGLAIVAGWFYLAGVYCECSPEALRIFTK